MYMMVVAAMICVMPMMLLLMLLLLLLLLVLMATMMLMTLVLWGGHNTLANWTELLPIATPPQFKLKYPPPTNSCPSPSPRPSSHIYPSVSLHLTS